MDLSGYDGASFFVTVYPGNKDALMATYSRKHRFSQIGKTVFFSREEAEAALEAIKKGG